MEDKFEMVIYIEDEFGYVTAEILIFDKFCYEVEERIWEGGGWIDLLYEDRKR